MIEKFNSETADNKCVDIIVDGDASKYNYTLKQSITTYVQTNINIMTELNNCDNLLHGVRSFNNGTNTIRCKIITSCHYSTKMEIDAKSFQINVKII